MIKAGWSPLVPVGLDYEVSEFILSFRLNMFWMIRMSSVVWRSFLEVSSRHGRSRKDVCKWMTENDVEG